MVRCIGTFTWGQPCRYNAKFGEFCGRHCAKEQKENVICCKRILKCGKSCSHAATENGFCTRHQFAPPDNKQHKLYSPDVGWPYMKNVLYEIRYTETCLKDVDICIKRVLDHILLYTNVGEEDKRENDNLCTMVVIEIFFRHYYFNYNTEYWQNIIVSYVNKIKEIPFLKDYCELFRRRFDYAYRLDAQKKYIHKVLTLNAKFGKDISRIIVSFL